MRPEKDIKNCTTDGIPNEELKRFEIWRQELKEAVETQDVSTFRKFYKRWTKNGFYSEDMGKRMTDEILEISIRKMAINMTDISPAVQKEAKAWLKARGYDLSLY